MERETLAVQKMRRATMETGVGIKVLSKMIRKKAKKGLTISITKAMSIKVDGKMIRNTEMV